MRLNEHDSQLAMAGVQLLERQFADRLEIHPESRGFDHRLDDDERRALDGHDRLTEVVRKLATGGDHELFDWEAEIIREGLVRYRSALSEAASTLGSIADENSQFITSEEQRKVELDRATTLLARLNTRRGS
jgi:hypothetical protein